MAIAVGVVIVGYGSSFISREQCEAMTAKRAARELGTRDVFVLTLEGWTSPVGYPGSETILRESGFNVIPCDMARALVTCLPWVGVKRAEVVYPFIVDVRWRFVARSTSRTGTRSRYVTVFGVVFLLADTAASPFAA